MAEPTYKDLIDLLNEAERDNNSTAEVLATMFCEAYPHISVSRPARLLETVRRIAGPVKCGKLKGSARTLYLKRTWTPRIRNTAPKRGIWFSYMCFKCVCVCVGGGGGIQVCVILNSFTHVPKP